MSERTSMMGEQVELRQKFQRQSVTVNSLKNELRALLSVTLDAHELDGEKILNTAAALFNELGDLEAMKRKLEILNRELGS